MVLSTASAQVSHRRHQHQVSSAAISCLSRRGQPASRQRPDNDGTGWQVQQSPPALAMAATGKEADDPLAPLLTLEDLLTLNLDAQWVVLSACNTATSDRGDIGGAR